MANIELSVVNESGDLQKIVLGGPGTDKELLIRSVIEALVSQGLIDANDYTDGKFGNYSFDGDDLKHGGESVLNALGTANIVSLRDKNIKNELNLQSSQSTLTHYIISGESANRSSITLLDNQAYYGIFVDNSPIQVFIDSVNGITLIGQTIAQITDGGPLSAVTKEWVQALYVQISSLIDSYTGNANEPVMTTLSGKIDSSLIPTQSTPQGNFTPTSGQEYPTISGNVAGDYWVVHNVGSGYLFVGGDLTGETVYESGWMVLDQSLSWFLSSNYPGATQTSWGGIIGTLADQIDLKNQQAAQDTIIDANKVKTSANDVSITELENNKLDDVIAGTNITIDKTNPLKPVINASGIESSGYSVSKNVVAKPPWYYFDKTLNNNIITVATIPQVTYPYTMYASGVYESGSGDKAVLSISGSATNLQQSIIFRADGTIGFYKRNIGTYTIESSLIISAGAPFIVVAVVNDTYIDFYVNGQYEQVAITSDTIGSQTELNIGCGRSAGQQSFEGYITGVALLDTELSDDKRMQLQTTGFIPNDNLIAGFGDGKAAGTWSDISGNGRDGTVTNTVLKTTY